MLSSQIPPLGEWRINLYDASASLRDAEVSLGETDLQVVLASFILPLVVRQTLGDNINQSDQ
jgi:hypothetical protein